MHTWQLQDAKNRFSEVVQEAIAHGPQIITRRGVETAVLISIADYQKLTLQRGSIVDYFRESPLAEYEIDLTRDRSPIPAELEL